MTVASEHIQFPQSRFVDDEGYVSLEWQQWLLNPQVLTINFSTAVDVASGGTGLTAGTPGGILGFITPTTIASSALLTQHALVLGGGALATPATPVGLGTTTTVLHGNAAGDPTWGAVVAADAPTLAPLASPALTGTPTAPTQTANDNSTKLATTAYADAAGGGWTLATPQPWTSGTSLDFTGLPSTLRMIIIMFFGVSTSGTSNPLIQIGDAGGMEILGYLGTGTIQASASAITIANYTTGFGFGFGAAANVMHGSILLTLENSSNNTWVANGSLGISNGASEGRTTGSKSLSAVLDRVRITTVGGTDTGDAGEINILYR